MEVNVFDIEPHRIVSIAGDVDLYNVSELKDALYQAIEEDVQSLVVDMKNIFYMDSSGIGSLLGAHKRMKRKGGRFSLVNMQKETREVFRLASLHNFFNIYQDIDDNYLAIPAYGVEAEPLPVVKKNENIETDQQMQVAEERVIFKGWVDDNTFRVPVDGFPNSMTTDIWARKIEAKQDALERAHNITLEYFVRYCKSRTWVVFNNYRRDVYAKYSSIVSKGIAKITKFDSMQNCTIIFEVQSAGLRLEVLEVPKSTKLTSKTI